MSARFLGWALVALTLVNAGVFGLRRSVSREHAVLVDLMSERSQKDSQARAARERSRALGVLVAQARDTAKTPSGIGELREMLLSAAHGLPINRISLDFRPREGVPAGFDGSIAQASFRGSFDALYRYLGGVERMFLPLTPENLTLRGDGADLTLTIRWAALWPLDAADSASAKPGMPGMNDLGGLELDRLNRWLSRESAPGIGRDPFAVRTVGAPAVPAPSLSPPEVVREPAIPVADDVERPVLTGFVLARPELEPDVRRRVLAALRYDSELHLLMVGDSVGAYRVVSIQARDSVTLQHAETAERLRLTLED